jgi:uncharacterized protein YbgA (DUF1722 family)
MNIPAGNSTESTQGLPVPPLHSPDVHALQQAVRALRTQFVALLVVLLVLSGSLNLFLLRHFRLMRAQAAELSQLVNDYEKTRAPFMNSVVTGLRDYARTHPDYLVILTNYVPLAESNAAARPAPPAKK